MCTWYLYFTSTSIFSNLELSLPTLLSSRRASCNCHNYEIVITYLYSFPLLINFFSVNIINGMRGILICYKVPSLRKHQELCKLLLPWNQYSISTYIKQILGFFNDLRSNISMYIYIYIYIYKFFYQHIRLSKVFVKYFHLG